MVLFFNLLMWYITLIDLWILKNPCTPGIKPTWSWCMIFLMHCWILIASILLRIFASIFIRDVGPYFFRSSGSLLLLCWRYLLRISEQNQLSALVTPQECLLLNFLPLLWWLYFWVCTLLSCGKDRGKLDFL